MIPTRYRYGGFTLHSPFALPGLKSLAEPEWVNFPESECIDIVVTNDVWADRRLEFESAGRFGLKLFRTAESYLFSLKGGAEFRVDREGSKISCRLGAGGWDGNSAEGFVRRILPHIMQLRGRQVLHAAVLGTPQGAVLICGVSGAGKSTLAALLNDRLGWELMADDVAILEGTKPHPRVFRSSHTISLWDNARNQLGVAFKREDLLEIYRSKFRCEPESTSSTDSLPVAFWYFLGGSKDDSQITIEAEEIDKMMRVGRMSEHAIAANRFDPDGRRIRLAGLIRLADSVSMRTLHYPRRFGFLDQVAAFVESDVAATMEMKRS